MLNLKDVTLVSIDGVGENDNHLKALKYSCKDINFGSVKFFCNKDFGKQNFYSYINIPKMSYDEYNKFCLVDLCDYIDTKYVLIVQDDGFVLNKNNWSEDYLKIGRAHV